MRPNVRWLVGVSFTHLHYPFWIAAGDIAGLSQ
jgi:hypothetical protein